MMRKLKTSDFIFMEVLYFWMTYKCAVSIKGGDEIWLSLLSGLCILYFFVLATASSRLVTAKCIPMSFYTLRNAFMTLYFFELNTIPLLLHNFFSTPVWINPSLYTSIHFRCCMFLEWFCLDIWLERWCIMGFIYYR